MFHPVPLYYLTEGKNLTNQYFFYSDKLFVSVNTKKDLKSHDTLFWVNCGI